MPDNQDGANRFFIDEGSFKLTLLGETYELGDLVDRGVVLGLHLDLAKLIGRADKSARIEALNSFLADAFSYVMCTDCGTQNDDDSFQPSLPVGAPKPRPRKSGPTPKSPSKAPKGPAKAPTKKSPARKKP